MKLVRSVMQLTPYGVLALMTKVVAGSNLQDIIKLGSFVVASYLGLLIMFAVHGILLGINGVSPLKYFRKVCTSSDVCLYQPFQCCVYPTECGSTNASTRCS